MDETYIRGDLFKFRGHTHEPNRKTAKVVVHFQSTIAPFGRVASFVPVFEMFSSGPRRTKEIIIEPARLKVWSLLCFKRGGGKVVLKRARDAALAAVKEGSSFYWTTTLLPRLRLSTRSQPSTQSWCISLFRKGLLARWLFIRPILAAYRITAESFI